MSVFFRSKYGTATLDYPLFEDAQIDTYESFILRSGGQDLHRAYIRDEMISSLAAEYTDVAVQKYRPVVLYLNGKYWGVYYLREKISEHFIAAHYNVPASTVTLTERNGNHCDSYQALMQYATSHDLSKEEYYDHICTLMDVPQYMDYIIAQICVGNSDNSNVRFFTYEGGKWRWILYDIDHGMRNANYNSVFEHLNPNGTASGDYISTDLINALLENKGFKDAFLRRFAWQLNEVWTEQNIHEKIDHFVSMIEGDMRKNCARWDYLTYDEWQGRLRDLRKYATVRKSYLLNYVQQYFDLSDKEMRQYGFIT